MRARHLVLGLAAFAWFGLGCQIDGGSVPRRHILLLTVDTLRSDHLGIHGYPLPTTPFLDELLAQGTRFPRTLAPVPRTTPALASLLTGAYPHTHEVRTLFSRLGSGVTSIAELLQARDYTTLAVISNHILIEARELNRGFDLYDMKGDQRSAAATTDAALARVDEFVTSPEDPVFLWVHYIDPHVPYYPPPDLAREFSPGYTGRYALNFGDVKGATGNQAYPRDLPKPVAVFQNPLPEEVNAHIRRLYAADVRSTDDQMRRLVRGLRQRLGDDWTIVFTSDHGESLGEHDFHYDHGDYVYNATLQVPLGFVFPEGDPLRRAAEVDDWVSLVDVMPTLLDVLDLELPEEARGQVEGRSLAPYLRGETMPARPAFGECGHSFFPKLVKKRKIFSVEGRFRCVVYDDWKLIWTPGLPEPDAFELYDLTADPHESQNLYAAGHPRVEPLRNLLNAWYQIGLQGGPQAIEEPTAEDIERLKSLGYMN